MTVYITFLVAVFVMGAVAPRTMRRPTVLLVLCAVLALSFLSARVLL